MRCSEERLLGPFRVVLTLASRFQDLSKGVGHKMGYMWATDGPKPFERLRAERAFFTSAVPDID